MIQEEIVRRASLDSQFDLEAFSEFVGTGVVPVRDNSDDLAVAVYVSKPRNKLSRAFKERVPKFVQVQERGKKVSIPILIVDIGQVKPQYG